VAGYYLYTAFLPESLAIDIGLFIASIVVGQMVGYSLMSRGGEHGWLNLLGAAALVIMAAAFTIFTFHAPHIDLFRDPITGSYGLA
jgi:ABC-type tungstate transport system substrate-binding protein